MSQRAKDHADSDEISIEAAKGELYQTLRHKTTRDDAVSSSALAGMVGLKATTVRDLIPELRQEYSLPVVACSKGYYVIQDTDDLARELERIQDEIETRKDTRKELTKAFNQHTYE